MLPKILIIWVVWTGLFYFNSCFACDFCTLYTGVLPQDRLNRLEFNHRFSRFRLFIPGNQFNPSGGAALKTGHQSHSTEQAIQDRTVTEDYRFVEIRYSFFPTQKIQVSLNLPWQNYRETDGVNSRERNGFGDLTAFAQYGILLKDRPNTSIRWFAGAGARIPTGWYYRNPIRYAEYFFEQGGRGSTGLMLLTTFNYRINRVGVSSAINWNWLTPRSFQYRPGSILNISQYFFALLNLQKGKIRLVPAWNFYAEFTEANLYRGYSVSNTGGISFLSGPDVSLYLGSWMLRSGLQLPIIEKLNGNQPKNVERVQIGLAWNFGQEK